MKLSKSRTVDLRSIVLAPAMCLLVVSFLSTTLGDEKTSESKEKPKNKWTAEDKERALGLFNATEKEFTESGTLKITYDFETMDDVLTADWMPDIAKTKNRIRWSRADEGTFNTVEHGIVIADNGTWLHKAQWKSIRMTVDYLSMTGPRAGDLLAATYTYKKGKKSLGNNMGAQLVRLSGSKLAAKPHPAKAESMAAESKYQFGYEFNGGVLTAYKKGHKKASSTDAPKLVKGKITPGNAGLIWRGNINGFVFKVTLEGELDRAWFDKQK